MRVIVGLGNPEDKHSKTRHNVGFMVVDRLQKLKAVGGNLEFKEEKKFNSLVARRNDLILVKPQTYMNASGEAVSRILNFYKASLGDLWVIHDDLDIRLGDFKIQKGTGPKVHNGVNSVEEKLGSKDFWRVRIGVDNREPEERARSEGSEYVLGKFRSQEEEILQRVIERVVEELVK